MRVLLIIPPTDLSASYGNLKDFSNPVPSLGLAYMAALLREHDHDVAILDAYVKELSVQDTVEQVAQHNPGVVGVSVLTTSAGVSEAICAGLREKLPSAHLVAGNMHASLFYEDWLNRGLVDAVAFRESEYTVLDLVQTWAQGQNLREIEGIAYKADGKVVCTQPRPYIDNLDELPFPAWDLYDMSQYGTDPRTAIKGFEGEHETQILATRGCPNQCTFCSSHTDRSLGMHYRMRSPESICNEMEHMHQKHGSRVFSFMDLAFPLVQKHAMAVCDEMIKRGLHEKTRWFTECRVKPLSAEMLHKMKQAGCVRVNFGIESGNDSTLERLKKKFTVSDVRRAIDLANQAGLEVDGMFMLGLPGESPEEAQNTIALARSSKIRFAIFNLFVPYPGCQLYDDLMDQGEIKYKAWTDFSSYWAVGGGLPVYIPEGWTPETLKQVQAKAMKSFYMSPRFIIKQIKDFKPSMIGAYWRGLKGVLGMSNSNR